MLPLISNKLSRWRLYGLVIDSPFPLPGAIPVDDTFSKDLTINWTPGIARIPGVAVADGISNPFEGPVVCDSPDGASALVWPGEMGLFFSPDGHSLQVVSQFEKLTYVPTVLVGIGLGWLLHRRGQVCLHGTALAWRGRSFGILGPSGSGKSTLATALVLRGATLLTDDVIVLRCGDHGFEVEPGCINIRMYPDTAAQHDLTDEPSQIVPWINKLLWHPHCDAPPEAVQLDRLVLLEPAESEVMSPRLKPLSPSRGLPLLTTHLYPPQLSHRLTSSHFSQLAKVAQNHSVSQVHYAHKWSHLEKLADLLLAEVV